MDPSVFFRVAAGVINIVVRYDTADAISIVKRPGERKLSDIDDALPPLSPATRKGQPLQQKGRGDTDDGKNHQQLSKSKSGFVYFGAVA
jgi:hypothetical protein